MKNLFFGLLMSTFLFAFLSCSDDDDTSLDNQTKLLEETKQYFPMEIGNYWVYDVYGIDPNGTETLVRQDSLKITHKKIVKGKTYFCMYNTHFREETLITDSAGYIIDDKGLILFSNINFNDILAVRTERTSSEPESPLLYETKAKMEKVDYPVSVPAGFFDEILNCSNIVTIYDEKSPWFGKDDRLKRYYVKNVGMILKTDHYVFSPTLYEYRLSKYRINGKTFPE